MFTVMACVQIAQQFHYELYIYSVRIISPEWSFSGQFCRILVFKIFPLTYGVLLTMHLGIILVIDQISPFTPNDPYSGRTVPLTFKVAFYIFIQ